MTLFFRVVLLLVFTQTANLPAADWIRAGLNTNQPVWGIQGGLLWALAPAGFRTGEPRGLIRMGYPVLPNGRYDLINFVAIEPIVRGQRGFSELEKSMADGLAGKEIWAQDNHQLRTTNLSPGTLSRASDGTEKLEVNLAVEKFENGAHVRLLAEQDSSRPDELKLIISAEEDTAALDCCILTATMGNMARTRLLWLKDRVVNSLELYTNYQADGFAPHREFPLPQLVRNQSGDVLVAVTTDEQNPSSVYPFPGSELWHYSGTTVTQFWRVLADEVRSDLQVAVNGRFMYWRSHQPVPGGIAFENFEMREKFHQGQSFIFGITRKQPTELGL